jgi:hypothetical protein
MDEVERAVCKWQVAAVGNDKTRARVAMFKEASVVDTSGGDAILPRV